MGLIAEQSHLSVIDPAMEARRAQTHPGMAHFARTGPEGKTCRLCKFWTGCGGENGYYARSGRHGGGLKPRSCSRYRDMMQGVGPGVPHDAQSCKYFADSETPPTLTDKR